mgnify:CR=1 FL=1
METQLQITAIKRMLKNITLLLLFLILNNLTVHSQNEKTFLVSNESITNFSINGLFLSDINEPGINFEKLNALGKPKSKNHKKTFVEEFWELNYTGVKLVYININGYPELSEMTITNFDSKFKICVKKNKITPNTFLESVTTTYSSKNSNKIKGELINKNTSKLKKFKNTGSFMEFQLNNKKISGIFLKNKIL